MPDLIRHPEGLERTGFRLEFIPMEIGAGMTVLIEDGVYGQTLIIQPCVTYFLPPSGPPGKPPILPKSMMGTAPPETCGKIPFHFSTLLY